MEGEDSADRLKKLRSITGMSQSRFAKYFGVSVRSIQGWEQGQKQPPTYLIPLMERILVLEGWELEEKKKF